MRRYLIVPFILLALAEQSFTQVLTAKACEEVMKKASNTATLTHSMLPTKVEWDYVAAMEDTQKKGHVGDFRNCSIYEILVQATYDPDTLRKQGILPQPDFYRTMALIIAGKANSPGMRKSLEESADKLRDNFLSIRIERAENGYGEWIPKVTVRNNCFFTNLRGVYLDLDVYDNQKRLIWDGNLMVDHLKARASDTREANYDPVKSHFIPDSVHSQVEVSTKRFSRD
jgi:hypothetical protein